LDSERATSPGRHRRLRHGSLAELRQQNRWHRAILQRVHIIHIDSYAHLREPERVLYEEALAHLCDLLPHNFRPPRRLRERAAQIASTDPWNGESLPKEALDRDRERRRLLS